MSEHIERMMQVGEINRRQLATLLFTFEAVIARSFEVTGGQMTRHEVRRRYLICEKWLRALRSEGWSVQRIQGALPQALEAELFGQTWDPTQERLVWTP